MASPSPSIVTMFSENTETSRDLGQQPQQQ